VKAAPRAGGRPLDGASSVRLRSKEESAASPSPQPQASKCNAKRKFTAVSGFLVLHHHVPQQAAAQRDTAAAAHTRRPQAAARAPLAGRLAALQSPASTSSSNTSGSSMPDARASHAPSHWPRAHSATHSWPNALRSSAPPRPYAHQSEQPLAAVGPPWGGAPPRPPSPTKPDAAVLGRHALRAHHLAHKKRRSNVHCVPPSTFKHLWMRSHLKVWRRRGSLAASHAVQGSCVSGQGTTHSLMQALQVGSLHGLRMR